MNQREIKFRAWNGSKMLKQDEIAFTPGISNMAFRLSYMLAIFQNDYAVMQYTGLKDKNGKEIYEGDVLLVFDEAVVPVTDIGEGPIEECNHIVSVEMRNGIWGFEIPKSDDGETGWYGLHYWNTDISDMGYEVIGNIYESPELINQ